MASFPHLTFLRIAIGFQGTFVTDVACQQGTLTPPKRLIPSHSGHACVLLVETNTFDF